mmetsp:Transcript_25126/g.83821  ORF Transcript_25126/g.83821 Transcript_25126/m.83821 type:complete len:206 (+) Transcript_25126:1247-1864(+)
MASPPRGVSVLWGIWVRRCDVLLRRKLTLATPAAEALAGGLLPSAVPAPDDLGVGPRETAGDAGVVSARYAEPIAALHRDAAAAALLAIRVLCWPRLRGAASAPHGCGRGSGRARAAGVLAAAGGSGRTQPRLRLASGDLTSSDGLDSQSCGFLHLWILVIHGQGADGLGTDGKTPEILLLRKRPDIFFFRHLLFLERDKLLRFL